MTVRRQIIHVDMDAFFASVEQLDDPSLRGRPVLVGGSVRRGVVAAASYEARPFGCHSAMPMAEAVRRCPDAVVVRPRGARYAEVSSRLFSVFRRFTPLVEGLSVDEAFLDVTASRALFGDSAHIAATIKEVVRSEMGLTASAGVAPCKFVAKIASDFDKPDGLVVVREDEVQRFLDPLAVERMWGVGPTAAARLRGNGLRTIGDLSRLSAERLEHLVGSFGRSIVALARGEDDRPVVPHTAPKSLGAEDTFEVDVYDRDALERHLLAQSERVAQRLVRESLCARVVTVKVKYRDFRLITRRTVLPELVADTTSIHEAARGLLARCPDLTRGVRLTGVSVSGLASGPPPPMLFPDARRKRRTDLEQVVAAIGERFGARGITRAALIEPSRRPPDGRADPEDEPDGPRRTPDRSRRGAGRSR